MSDDEVTDFIICRLAELAVVLCREHVGSDDEAAKARSETRQILMQIGNWAARHGRADLMPPLHGLAAQINGVESGQELGCSFLEVPKISWRISYRW